MIEYRAWRKTAAQIPEDSGIPASANYRPASDFRQMCATCDWYDRAHCEMFSNADVDPIWVCDEWDPVGARTQDRDEEADPILAAARKTLPVAHLNKTSLQAIKRARRVLEPKLAAVLEPVLDAAADTAARNFTQTVTPFVGTPTVTAAGTTTTREARALQEAFAEYDTAENELATAQRTGDAKLIAIAIRKVDAARRRLTGLLHPVEQPIPGTGQQGQATGQAIQAPVVQQPVQQVTPPSRKEIAKEALKEGLKEPVGTEVRDSILQDLEREVAANPPTPGILERIAAKYGADIQAVQDLVIAEGVADKIAAAEARAAGVAQVGKAATWAAPAGSEVLDTGRLASDIREVTAPVRDAMVSTVMGPTMQAVGLTFDATDPLAGKVLSQSASQIVGISETTQADVMKVIHDAYEQGLSIPNTATAIQAVMKEATPARARLIARTELAGAVNGASLAATQIVADATGMDYKKKWLTAPGARYPRHEDYDGLDGQTADLSDPFEVGDAELQFPGDPDGPPGEVCNCRCTVVYEEGGTELVEPAATEPSQVQDVTAQASDGPTSAVPSPAVTPGGTAPDTLSVGAGTPVPLKYRQQVDKLGLNTWPPVETANAKKVLNGFKDTKTEFQAAPGVYDASRLPLHEDIVQAHYVGKTLPPSGEKTAFFTAGGGASGKGESSFIIDGKPVTLNALLEKPDIVSINSDSIKEMLPEYKQMTAVGDPYAAAGVHEESSDLAKVVYDKAISDGYSFVYDSTASSGDSKFIAKLLEAKENGYQVNVSMTSIPTNEAIVRSLLRGDQEGRYLAMPALKDAHAGASRNFVQWQHSDLIDHWTLYDNEIKPELVAEGGVGLPPTVYDKAKYNAILAKADEGLTQVPKDPILGITPFRAGEDNPLGFYSTQKAKQFEADLKTVSQENGVTITSADHVTGVWEGETEPSYSVHAYDGAEGVQHFAEEMRAKYDQDGVMVFTPQKALPTGAVTDAVQYRISGIDTQAAIAGMPKYRLSGGTVFGHQIEIVGSEADADKINELAKDLGGKVTLRRGQVEFIERPEEPSLGVLKAPDPASMLDVSDVQVPDTGGQSRAERLHGRTPDRVYQQQQYQATSVLSDGLPQQDPNPSDTILEYDNREFAKQQVTDTLDSALADNPAWVMPAPPEFVPVTDLKVGDVITTDNGTVELTKITHTEQEFGEPTAADDVLNFQRFYVEDPATVQIPGLPGRIAKDTLLSRAGMTAPEGMVRARIISPGVAGLQPEGLLVDVPKDALVRPEISTAMVEIDGKMAMPVYGQAAGEPYAKKYFTEGLTVPDTVMRNSPGDAYPFPEGQGGTGADAQSSSKVAISGLVDTWAGTSADESPYSLALQKAIDAEFGLTDDTLSVIAGRDETALATADAIYAEKGPQLRAFVRTEYDQTQKMLDAAGIKDLTLYRGFSLRELPDSVKREIPMGASIQDVTLQPASSFSASWATAKNFASGDSAIIGVQVPASRILATPRSGIGALNEAEYVVLGPTEGAVDDQAYFHRFQGIYSMSGNVGQFWQAGVTPTGLKFGPLRMVEDWRAAGAPTAGTAFKIEGSSTVFKVVGADHDGGVKAFIVNGDGSTGGALYLNKGINVQVAGEKGGLPDNPKWVYSPEIPGYTVEAGDKVALTQHSLDQVYDAGDEIKPAGDTIFKVVQEGKLGDTYSAPTLEVIDAGSGTLPVGASETIYDTTKLYPVAEKVAGGTVIAPPVPFKAGAKTFPSQTEVGDQVMLDGPTIEHLNKIYQADFAPDTVLSVTATYPNGGVDATVVYPPAQKAPKEVGLVGTDGLFKAEPVMPTIYVPTTKSPFVVAETSGDSNSYKVGDLFAYSTDGPIWQVTGYDAGVFKTKVVDPNGSTTVKKGFESQLGTTETTYPVSFAKPDTPPPVDWSFSANPEAVSQLELGDTYAGTPTGTPVWKLVSKDPDGTYTAEVVDSHGSHFDAGYVTSGVSPTATMYKTTAATAAEKGIPQPKLVAADPVTPASLLPGDYVKPAQSWVGTMKNDMGPSGFDATGATFVYNGPAGTGYFSATVNDPGTGNLPTGDTVILPYAGTVHLKSKA